MGTATGTSLLRSWIGGMLALGMLAGGQAQAATQGEMGASSTGSIAIGVRVAASIQTIGLSDVTLEQAGPAATAIQVRDVCVRSNTTTRLYSITASGSGPGHAFVLANGSEAAPYAVAWSSSPDRTSATLLTPGMALTGQTATDCAPGQTTTASLIVRAAPLRGRLLQASYSDGSSQQFMRAEGGYAGALTLIVSPQ